MKSKVKSGASQLRKLTLLLLAAATVSLAGCGQKGPLVRPDPQPGPEISGQLSA